MLLHGDELGRTQRGNNNGYAQDNELTWVDWDAVDQPLLEFTAALAALRREHPTFRRRRFFDGRPVRRPAGAPIPDIVWGRPDGTQMQPEDWDSGFGRAIGVFLNGRGIRGRDARGRAIVDKHFFILFNAGDDIIDFHIPEVEFSPSWDVLVDTAGAHGRRRSDRAGIDGAPRSEVHARAARARAARTRGRSLGRGIPRPAREPDGGRPRAGAEARAQDLNARAAADQATPSQERSVSTIGPSSVIATVCSECAPREPSALRSVQPSGSVTSSSVVSRNQGSSATTRPARSG